MAQNTVVQAAVHLSPLSCGNAVYYIERATHAILMKAVVPISPAEPGPTQAVDLSAARLRAPAVRIKQWVLVDKASPDVSLVNSVR